MKQNIKNKSKKTNKSKKINKSLKKKKLSYDVFNVIPKVYNINDYKIILLNYPCNVTYIESFINNGNINENKNNCGINHLLEHVLIESWAGCKNKPCLEVFGNKGIYLNAYTDNNNLSYFTKSLNDDLDETLDYIINITTKAIIKDKYLKYEKQPIINELLMYLNNTERKLFNLINNFIYTHEGLKYSDNYKKQLENLDKLHLKDVIDYYKKNYTPKNTIFLVSGKINTQHVLNIFKKKLPKPKKNDKINIFDNCFTFKNTNIFLKNVKSKTSTCIICFPTNLKYYDKKSYILKLAIMCLRYILFVHLRYDKSLIYSIKTDINKNSCGTLITFKYYTPSFNTNKTLNNILNVIKTFKTKCIKESIITSNKKKYLIDYLVSPNDPSLISKFYGHQYLNQMHLNQNIIYTPKEVKDIIIKTTGEDIKNILNETLIIENMIFSYEANKCYDITY